MNKPCPIIPHLLLLVHRTDPVLSTPEKGDQHISYAYLHTAERRLFVHSEPAFIIQHTLQSEGVFNEPGCMHEHGKGRPVGTVMPLKVLVQQIIRILFIDWRSAAIYHITRFPFRVNVINHGNFP